jgi:hypothetical protein
LLEVLRIGAWSTGTRNSVGSTAAVGICIEGKAGTLAPNNRAIGCLQPELLWALGVDIECTCDSTAACDSLWDNRNWKVEAIHIAYVIEIFIACTIERELDQGCWRDSPHVIALQLHNVYRLSIKQFGTINEIIKNFASDLARGTISRLTDEASCGIGTALSSPETPRPMLRDINCMTSTRIKLKSSERKRWHASVSQ